MGSDCVSTSTHCFISYIYNSYCLTQRYQPTINRNAISRSNWSQIRTMAAPVAKKAAVCAAAPFPLMAALWICSEMRGAVDWIRGSKTRGDRDGDPGQGAIKADIGKNGTNTRHATNDAGNNHNSNNAGHANVKCYGIADDKLLA